MPTNKNAQKHGLLSRQLIISQEDIRPFNKFTKKLIAELAPSTTLEKMLAEQIVVNYWRLKGFIELENEVLKFAGKPKWILDSKKDFVDIFTEFVKSNPSFDLLSRYNASISRSFYRSINEYKKLKTAQLSDESNTDT